MCGSASPAKALLRSGMHGSICCHMTLMLPPRTGHACDMKCWLQSSAVHEHASVKLDLLERRLLKELRMYGVVRHFLSNLQSTFWTTTTARYRKAGGTLFIELMASASSSTTSCTMQQSFAELPSQVQLSASAGHVMYICMPQSSTCRRRHVITQTAVLHRVRRSLRHIQGCQSCKHTSSRPTRKENTHPPAPLVLPYRNAHARIGGSRSGPHLASHRLPAAQWV